MAGSRGINTQIANPKIARTAKAVTPTDNAIILRTLFTQWMLHLHSQRRELATKRNKRGYAATKQRKDVCVVPKCFDVKVRESNPRLT